MKTVLYYTNKYDKEIYEIFNTEDEAKSWFYFKVNDAEGFTIPMFEPLEGWKADIKHDLALAKKEGDKHIFKMLSETLEGIETAEMLDSIFA